MARIRSVRPELRTSLTVAEWQREIRYFFVLLWGYLDDEGRGVDDDRLIKSDCFPLDDDVTTAVIDAWLALMEPTVCRYSVGSRRYLHIPSWHEHQKPQHPRPSLLPACPRHSENLLPITGEPSPDVGKGLRPEGSSSKEGEGEVTGSRNDPKPKRAKPKTPPPESFTIDDDLARWADERGISSSLRVSQTERFLDYHRSKGNTFADWRAAWRNWMSRVEVPNLSELRPSEHWVAATGGDVA